MAKSIYEMKLHETIFLDTPSYASGVNDSASVTRVPGGWIYTTFSQTIGEKEVSTTSTSVFVKYDEEFKQEKQERF